MEEKRKQLAIRLFEINAYKFGEFKLKSGLLSPVYFDLRVIVSFPDVMDQLADYLLDFLNAQDVSYEQVCGVPYTALPIATLISVKAKKPMLIRRQEKKEYGTKKQIEGKFEAGQTCLIIEDVVTSGSSVLETVSDLKKEGLQVTDAIIVVDREQGGKKALKSNNIQMKALFTLSYLLETLSAAGLIEKSMVEKVSKWIAENQVQPNGTAPKKTRTQLTFDVRANEAKSEVAKNLFKLMALKRTNLCLAADVAKTSEIIQLAEKAGPFICLLKLHVDVIEDFSPDFIKTLKSISKMHNFMIMEDRKFADIGNTVALQYTSGVFKISDWADLVTAHTLPGPNLLKALKSRLGVAPKERGVFLLAELSSADNLINQQYTAGSIKMATEGNDSDFVAGIVCQNGEILTEPGLVQLTPGVKLDEGGDNLGQQYNAPDFIVREKGADIGVVGRGIYEAKNAAAVAESYRNALWAAYCERVGIKNEN